MSAPGLTPPLYCIRCKAEIPGDTVLCPRCGQDQRERVKPVLPETPGRARKKARALSKTESGVRLMTIGGAIVLGARFLIRIDPPHAIKPLEITAFLFFLVCVGFVVCMFGVYRLIVGRLSGD